MNYLFAILESELTGLDSDTRNSCVSAYDACLRGDGLKQLTTRYVDESGAAWLIDCAWEPQMSVSAAEYSAICEQFRLLCPSIKYAVTDNPTDVLFNSWKLQPENQGEMI